METLKKPIQKISGNIKKNAWASILESIATIILGIFLIVWPDTVIKIVVYIVGLFFLIKGAYQIINYFMVKGQEDFFNNNLLGGVISVLVGLALLFIGEEIANIFRIAIGIWLVYESLVRLSVAVRLHAAKIAAWKYVTIFSLMTLVLGVFVTFYDGAVVALIGWMMVLAGVIGVVSDAVFIQYVNKIADALTGKTGDK